MQESRLPDHSGMGRYIVLIPIFSCGVAEVHF